MKTAIALLILFIIAICLSYAFMILIAYEVGDDFDVNGYEDMMQNEEKRK